MNVERNGEVEICPYWRKWVVYGKHILALCAAESPDEQPLTEGEGFRLQKCILFPEDTGLAFRAPMILEVSPGRNGDKWDMIVGNTNKGLKELEEVWPQEVEKFIERHSQ